MNKTPISILQELMVKEKQPAPSYDIEPCGDVPGPYFRCTVRFKNYEARGFAATKQGAKQNSAERALEIFGFKTCSITEKQTLAVSNTSNVCKAPLINYVGKLNEFASGRSLPYPDYTEEHLFGCQHFVTNCSFVCWTTKGYGIKKKDSKQDAARKMLHRIETEKVPDVPANLRPLELNQERTAKIVEINEEIIKAYEKLSVSNNCHTNKETTFLPMPNLKDTVRSLDELKEELAKYAHKYVIETFQRNPYIMMMKVIDTPTVLMGTGNTKEEAMKDLLETAILIFSEGFSIDKQL